MHLALVALRMLGAFGIGLLLGGGAIYLVGEVPPEPAVLGFLVVAYGVVGGAMLLTVAPRYGLAVLLGWAAPWLLITWVVITDEFLPYAPFPIAVTVLYVLTLIVAFLRSRRRR